MEDRSEDLISSISDDELWDIIQYMRILVREQGVHKKEKESA